MSDIIHRSLLSPWGMGPLIRLLQAREEAWSLSAFGQGYGELGNIGRSSSANKQSKEPSPPSINNRYGNGIKTRLAKLFNKGNACMEEPKVIEPQRNQDVIHHFPHNLLLATSGNHRPPRYQ